MDFKKLVIVFCWLVLCAFDYQSPVREPFEDYNTPQMVQSYNAAPKAPIDWNNLPYDDPYDGWYYKLLWYLYHPNSTETPPWLIPKVPIGDGVLVLMVMVVGYCHRFWRYV